MTPYILIGLGILFLALYRFIPKRGSFRSYAIDSVSASELTRLVMAVIVSITVLFSAIYIVLSQEYGEPSEKWAFGAIGLIIGFWLRPEGNA